MEQPLLYETHCHTTLCKHATGTPDEYAAMAKLRRLAGLTITCHNPMPDGFSPHVRMDQDEFRTYLDLVDRTRRAWQGQVDVRLGIEADYFPGYEGWLEKQLRMTQFDYVLGSVHPQLREFRNRFWSDDPVEFQRVYFEMLADAAETGLFDCLAHPDLVKNETADFWNPDLIEDEIHRALDRIAATGIAMELNTSGLHKRIPEMNPGVEMLLAMHARGIPVTVGADAHDPSRVGEGFEEALHLLEQCGYEEVQVYFRREPTPIPIAAARESMQFRPISAAG